VALTTAAPVAAHTSRPTGTAGAPGGLPGAWAGARRTGTCWTTCPNAVERGRRQAAGAARLVDTAMPAGARAALGRTGHPLAPWPRPHGPIDAIGFDRAHGTCTGRVGPFTGRATALAGESSDGRVTVRHEPDAMRWSAVVDGGEAELAYEVLPDGGLDLQHTLVPHAARGAGVADALVRAAVAHARAEGVRLVPTCPYVAAWAARHRDAADVFVAGAA
jgi:predicted GNAT family acetyltransferase